MCGISGIYNFNGLQADRSLLTMINNTLTHRGPDHGDIATIGAVGLGQRRLSIIDLSELGNQPMATEDGRFTLVFNGEVYNFRDLKKELLQKGVQFKSQSDTEVVLKSFQHWGTNCFSKFNGMFALAIYDAQTEEIILARDQFGIKPLYFYKNENTFVFASEMKAIKAHPSVNLSVNAQALSEYIWYGNPMGNNTIYQQIEEIDAGTFLKIKNKTCTSHRYFDINSITEIDISEEETISQIKILFEKSVERHLISDVPVGVFLSGGIDSSAITGIASKYYQGTLKTYSVGFDFIKGPNELQKAAMVAKKFGTNHNEVHISGADTIAGIEALVQAHDEPFGDAADIPLYLLTKELKGQVKVVLQGDGGDEFFGGYSIYNTMTNVNKWKRLSFLSSLISFSGTKNAQAIRFQRFVEAISDKNPAKRNAKLLTIETRHTNPFRVFNDGFQMQLKDTNPFLRYEEVYQKYASEMDAVQSAFYTDSQIILKDTFFEKVDKSTMANSIEVRVPFLDKDLTEFMLSVPSNLKVKKGEKKYLLKKAMEGLVPNEILYGPKTGFSVPYAYWLKTSLAEYFKEQISTSKAKELLDQKEILRIFRIHQQGKGNYGFLLWKTLILAIWINTTDISIA